MTEQVGSANVPSYTITVVDIDYADFNFLLDAAIEAKQHALAGKLMAALREASKPPVKASKPKADKPPVKKRAAKPADPDGSVI